MIECVAAEMRNTLVQSATLREVNSDRVKCRLQLKCRDMASSRVGEKARRAADARADVEHAAARPEP